MKSIVFIAFLAIAAASCHSPEKSTGSDTAAPPTMSSDSSSATTPATGSTTDTVSTTPVTPVDTSSAKPMSTDTTTHLNN